MPLVNKHKWRRGGLLLLLLLPFFYWLGFQSWATKPSLEDLARWSAAFRAQRAEETNYPVTRAVTLSCTSQKRTYLFGERQQWVFLFSNASPETVYFSNSKTNGCFVRTSFHITKVREDGNEFISGSDLCRESDNLKLEPGQTRILEYPPPALEMRRFVDEYTPLPGRYGFHAKIWMRRQGQLERLLSAEQHFTIVDDGSGDVQKVLAARSGCGVIEDLELIIRRTNSTQVELSTRNHGKETLYLGSGWSWWSKSSWSKSQEGFGGLGGGRIIEVPPGQTVQIRWMNFGDNKLDGFCAVEARYYVGEADRLKTSNRIYVWARGPVSEFVGDYFQAVKERWSKLSKAWTPGT